MNWRRFAPTEAELDAAIIYGEHMPGRIWTNGSTADFSFPFEGAPEGAMPRTVEVLPGKSAPERIAGSDAQWRRLFAGNAFDCPSPETRRNRRRLFWRMRRTLRALLRWLRKPSFWSMP